MENQEAIGRKSESLRNFSGQPSDFINGSEHFMDHMARAHRVWRPTLVWMSKIEELLTMHRLRNYTIGPYNENAGDLTLKLEQTIIDWLPETLHKKRVQLAGGPGETRNGFAVWRRLFRDNKGSGDVVEYAGIEVLRDYLKCNKLSELPAHLDGWNELLVNYGAELAQAPRTLRSMFMGIIPKDLKSEILKEKDLIDQGFRKIEAWRRKRVLVLQNEHLAEIA